MDSYGNGYSSVGGKRSADDGGAETESDSKKQRCEPSRVVHLRNLHQYVTEQEVISTVFFPWARRIFSRSVWAGSVGSVGLGSSL